MAAAQTVFEDAIVSATTLNRRSGEVLDQAWEKCVTIMRNDQAFALLRRDRATLLVTEASRARQALELLHAVVRICSGEKIDAANPFEWVTAFGPADLARMADEILVAYGRARSGEIAWEEFDALVHEWQESAWAARNPALREALRTEPDEPAPRRPRQTSTSG